MYELNVNAWVKIRLWKSLKTEQWALDNETLSSCISREWDYGMTSSVLLETN